MDVDEKTELRLSDTVKEKISISGEMPKSLQKLREGKENEIEDSDYKEKVENPRNRNLEFVEKPVQTGTEVNLLFEDRNGEKPDEISLITDEDPVKVGLKLLPKALLLTGIGVVFLIVGITSLTWI